MNKVTLFFALTTCILVLDSFQQKEFDLDASIKRGRDSYLGNCISCHMDNGEGIEGVFPPLAKSDYLMEDNKRAAQQILYGARGPMVVNGKTYTLEMNGFDFSDEKVSDILNYIRNSWGNKGDAITPTEVKAARK